MTAGFLIAHHHPEDYCRCYRFGSHRVCARCLGLYAVMIPLLALEIVAHPKASFSWEPWAVLALSLPAVVDWARGRLDPSSGTNPYRTFTGVLLGISLARTVYLNMVHPANALSVAHFAGLASIAGVVEVVARPHRLKLRLERGEPKEET